MVPCERNEKGQLLSVFGQPCVPAHLHTIRIPPAWRDVMVDPNPASKLWATGTDSKGRRQPLYNPAYRSAQDAAKFASVQQLIAQASLIQSTIERDAKSLCNEAALVAYLIFETGIRPGSEADTKGEVQAYGATTLRCGHVVVEGSKVFLRFIGKKGVQQNIHVQNEWLAEWLIIRSCDGGKRMDRFLFTIDERDLRRYVATIGDGTARPKDFRTMKGTMLAASELDGIEIPATKNERKALLKSVVNVVCSALGNTPAIARKSYIAPFILAALAD